MAVWMPQCGLVHDTTDVATDIEVVAPDEVRDFVAAHGGRLFVWVSAHPGLWFPTCLLEASLEPPRGRDLSFRRVEAPGFELYLEGTQTDLAEDDGVRAPPPAPGRGVLERHGLGRLTRQARSCHGPLDEEGRRSDRRHGRRHRRRDRGARGRARLRRRPRRAPLSSGSRCTAACAARCASSRPRWSIPPGTCTSAGSWLPASTCTSRPRSGSGRRRWSSPSVAGVSSAYWNGLAWIA